MQAALMAVDKQAAVQQQQQKQNANNVPSDNDLQNINNSSIAEFGKVFDSNGTMISNETYSQIMSQFRNERKNQNKINNAHDIGDIENEAMDSVKRFYAKFDAMYEDMYRLRNKNDINQADLLKLQCSMTELNLLADLTSKVSEKVSQAAQTLFRNQ